MAWIKTSKYTKTESIDYQGLYIQTEVEGFYNTDSSTAHKVKYRITYYLGNASSTKSYTIQDVDFTEGLGTKLYYTYVTDAGGNKWYFDDNAWRANESDMWKEPYTVGPSAVFLKLTHSESEEFEWPGHVNIGHRRVRLKINDEWIDAIDQSANYNVIIPDDSPVPNPTGLAQYPELIHAGDYLKLTLAAGTDPDIISGETSHFFDEGNFTHKIYILSDDLYQYLGEMPYITSTSGSQVSWAIPMEWNQMPILAQYPDSEWPLDFYVETYAAGGMFLGTSAYYRSAIKYLPAGVITNGEIQFDAQWKVIDDFTINLTNTDKAIIGNISTVVVNVLDVGYFEGGFRATITNRNANTYEEIVQIGELNQTEFTFYQNCVSNSFNVKVQAAGYETTRNAWTGDLTNANGKFINYYKPIVNVSNTQMDSQGVADIIISGQVARASFDPMYGVQNGIEKVEYRYSNSFMDSGWIDITSLLTIHNGSTAHSFNWQTTLKLPVGYNYNLEARITDSLYTTTSPASVIMYRPVFDWSQNDFKFNVDVTAAGDNLFIPIGTNLVYHNRIVPHFEVGTRTISSNCITPSKETAAYCRYLRFDDVVIMSWYYSGLVETTVDKFAIDLSDFIDIPPLGDIHWQSGGGNAANFKIMQNGHSFCGWNIESVDGIKALVGRTSNARTSESDSRLVSNYLGAVAGQTIHASGTIMYWANPIIDNV